MKKRIITLLAASTMTLTTTAAFASKHYDGVIPYIGADAQWRHMNFRKGFGANLVKDDYPQGNVYFGVKFNDYVGLEAGYESTTSKTQEATLLGSDDYLGGMVIPEEPNSTNKFSTTTKVHGPHVNIIGFLPIFAGHRLQLIGSIGIAQLKINIAHTVRVFGNESSDLPTTDKFTKRKWIAKANGGLQYMLNDQFGTRTTVTWENTSHFRDIKSPNVPLYSARIKNSLGFGLGLFYNFK